LTQSVIIEKIFRTLHIIHYFVVGYSGLKPGLNSCFNKIVFVNVFL